MPAHVFYQQALAPAGVGLSDYYIYLINSANAVGWGDDSPLAPGRPGAAADMATMLAWHYIRVLAQPDAGLAAAAESRHNGATGGDVHVPR